MLESFASASVRHIYKYDMIMYVILSVYLYVVVLSFLVPLISLKLYSHSIINANQMN